MAFNSTINTGTTPNDGQGDGLRTNMRKLIDNDNYLKDELETLQEDFTETFKDNLSYELPSGQISFKAIKLTGIGISSSFEERVILLIPVSESTDDFLYNRISGSVIAAKYGSNVWDVINIDAQSNYNSTVATFSASGQKSTHKLVTCNYNGVKWLALKIAYSANPRFEYYFRGFFKTDSELNPNSDELKVLSYYNVSTSTVVNTEIHSSIADFTNLGSHQFGSEIFVNGNINCVTLIQTSDKKYKKNIEYIDGEWALDIYKKLKFSFYDFTLTKSKSAGLIAQEVEKILPQAVHTTPNGEKGLNHTYIDMVCKAAIQHYIKTNI